MGTLRSLTRAELIDFTQLLLTERQALFKVTAHQWDDPFSGPSDVHMNAHSQLVDEYNTANKAVAQYIETIKAR
jgi:hypothetical protein